LYYYSIAISKNPLNRLFTYSSDTPLKPGSRVKIQFAKRKKDEIAYVVSESDIKEQDKKFEIKKISEIIDNEPIIDKVYLELLNWVVDYYMNPPGVVYDLIFKNTVSPRTKEQSLMKRKVAKTLSDSKKIVVINKKMGDIPLAKISDAGIKIIQYLYFYPDLSVSELKKKLSLKSASPVKTLINNQILQLKTINPSEETKERKITKAESPSFCPIRRGSTALPIITLVPR
jgi:primosomal protein N'